MPTVTESLSRGLRRGAFAAWNAEVTNANRRARHELSFRRDASWKQRKAFAEAAYSVYEKAAFARAIVRAENQITCVFLVGEEQADSALAFKGIVMQIGRRSQPLLREVPFADLRPHAVERLFQRLGTVDLATARHELETGLLLSVLLREAARSAGILQLGLPTQSGMLLGDAAPDDGRLIAQTWHRADTGRWRDLRDELMDVAAAVNEAAATRGDPDSAVGMLLGLHAGSSMIVDAMRDVLSRYPFLRDPYQHQPDPVGEAWNAARGSVDGIAEPEEPSGD